VIISLFKPKKKKKSQRSYLIGELDKITSIKVRTRDGYKCRKCGREKVSHHHIFTKVRLTTRWDLSNGLSLCFYCHRNAHAAAEEFRAWVVSWMGQKEYDALYLKSQMRGGFKESDLTWLLKEMRLK
jgi:hypothetical protein